jgi:hypothetical protein
MTTLFDRLAQLEALDELTPKAVGQVLGIELEPDTQAHPSWVLHAARPAQGDFSRVELWLPGAGATSQHRRVLLTLTAALDVRRDDVETRRGAGKLFQLIPSAGPEGIATFVYRDGRRAVAFQYSAKSFRLVEIELSHAAAEGASSPPG